MTDMLKTAIVPQCRAIGTCRAGGAAEGHTGFPDRSEGLDLHTRQLAKIIAILGTGGYRLLSGSQQSANKRAAARDHKTCEGQRSDLGDMENSPPSVVAARRCKALG